MEGRSSESDQRTATLDRESGEGARRVDLMEGDAKGDGSAQGGGEQPAGTHEVPDRAGAGSPVGGARKKVRKTGGHYCCVVGCHNNLYADGPRGIKFYRFPKIEKQPERHEKWITKVNRLNPDGSQWRPVLGMQT